MAVQIGELILRALYTASTAHCWSKMISLLNSGVDKYLEELGHKSFKNPSFVFVERPSQAA